MITINGLQMVLSTNLKLLKHRGKGLEKMCQSVLQKNGWTLTNVNGKTTYVSKGSSWHDLKRA